MPTESGDFPGNRSSKERQIARLRELATGAVIGGEFLREQTQEVAHALFAYADLLKAQQPQEARGTPTDDDLMALADKYDSSGSAGAIHRYHMRYRDMIALLRKAMEMRPPNEPTGWRPIETAPHNMDALFLIVPKPPEEAYTDTDGKPITGKFAPYIKKGAYGCWNGLAKATHWHPLPSIPLTKGGSHAD